MGIDYGSKRTGLAVTDPLKMIAQPLEMVYTADLKMYLDSYLYDEDVECFVVGMPTNLNGTDTDATQPVKQFIEALKNAYPNIPVNTIDERLTSHEAPTKHHRLGSKKIATTKQRTHRCSERLPHTPNLPTEDFMILPIYAYGMPVLRKKAEDITPEYEGLSTLLENMFETMYDSSGIGLAAPQIGLPIRLFIVDGSDIEDDPSTKDFKKIFINAQILEEFDTAWEYEEGCLSIPFVRANVKRNAKVTIQYLDENFVQKTETYEGMAARIIQHEYDHIEGILFTDRIHPLKRNMLKKKLNNISLGLVNAPYKMKFPKK